MKNSGFPDKYTNNDEFVTQILQQLSFTDEELNKTRKELIKRKEEAADFSYAISHTLRKNLANVKGIIDILNSSAQTEETKNYLEILANEVSKIDEELHNLNEIVKLQYSDLESFEWINLKETFQKIKELFASVISEDQIEIEEDFSALNKIFSVKSLVFNVFEELLKNSIKFKHPNRKLQIVVGSYISKDRLGIEFTDNGIGIDLKKYKEKIFKPSYKINPQIKGKGIGLYLLKYQVESFGGELEIASQINKGTTVRIYLERSNPSSNVVLNSPVLKVVYFKEYNLMVANWKRKVHPNEFREMFSYILKLMEEYKLKHWIANLINAKNDEQKLNEVRSQFSEKLKKIGLKKMGLVAPREEINEKEKAERLKTLKKIYDFEVQYFKTLTDAIGWVKQH